MGTALNKPDFLVIGAQKCATTWLHHHLSRHPGVFLPAGKDVEFFSYSVNMNSEISRAWFQRFDEAPGGARIGDVNGAYFWTGTGSPWSVKIESFNRHIPESVHSLLGDEMQFIVSLRNPAERAVSAYLHHIVHGAVTPSQKLLDINEPLGIVDMGFFGAHLRNWLKVYPAGRFLVLRDLPSDRNSASALMSGTLAFLGLDAFDDDDPYEKPVYQGMPRLIRPDGVWVPAEHPSIAPHLPLTREVRNMEQDGISHLCLVDEPEMARLGRIYEPDQVILYELLSAGGITVLNPAAGVAS